MSSPFGQDFENRLTAEHMKNTKFQNTEEQILEVVSKRKRLSVKEIAKKVGISRSTFYRHHKTSEQLTQDYADYLLNEYKDYIGKQVRHKHSQLKVVYIRTLFFISRHGREFGLLKDNEDRALYIRMLKYLEKKIITTARLPVNSGKTLSVYYGEISELFVAWSKKRFSPVYIEKILRDIMHLTNTMRERLGWLEAESEAVGRND